eukprot:GHVT01021796.1.p1 GENE.GHVT01021796.1~~GHVT01021796.1.p1  ORF type:complete len:190 (+),score=52.75 GHVT01021796.1:330-899(+)
MASSGGNEGSPASASLGFSTFESLFPERICAEFGPVELTGFTPGPGSGDSSSPPTVAASSLPLRGKILLTTLRLCLIPTDADVAAACLPLLVNYPILCWKCTRRAKAVAKAKIEFDVPPPSAARPDTNFLIPHSPGAAAFGVDFSNSKHQEIDRNELADYLLQLGTLIKQHAHKQDAIVSTDNERSSRL